MKKLLFRGLSLSLALCLLVFCVSPAGATEGQTESFSWRFEEETATLVISGSGDIPDYAYSFSSASGSSHPWSELCPQIRSVTVEEGITSVGSYAFYNCPALQTVTLPSTVTELGNHAFAYCKGLKELKLPAQLSVIGADAFYHCGGLERISLPDGVTNIPDRCFAYCGALKEVTLSSDTAVIGTSAFYSCGSLGQLLLPAALQSIGASAFSYCGVTELHIPESVTQIGRSAFSHCGSLGKLSFSEGLVSIGEAAFAHCTALVSLQLPDSVNELGTSAFQGCSALTAVRLGQGIRCITVSAFSDCGSLLSISLSGALTEILTDAFDHCSALHHILYAGSASQWDKVEKERAQLPAAAVLHTGCQGTEVFWAETAGGSYLYCSLCDLALTPIPDCPHENTQTLRTVEPTCTQEGYSGDLCCTDCNSVLQYGTVLSPLGHRYEAGLCVRCGVVDTSSSPFTDIRPTDYYYVPVLWAYYHGITTGVSAAEFAPGALCTRGQIVTFLWRAAGCPQPESTQMPFADVSESDYFYTAVLWAVEQGITTGVTADLFDPEAQCTRAQAVVFLHRTEDCPQPSLSDRPFADVTADRYYYEAVLWAAENGITSGTEPDRFSPEEPCTRGQIVTFLYRLFSPEF